MKLYQLGVIGYGSMAGTHNRQLSKEETRIRVKGVYDVDPSRTALAREQGLVAYPSEAALLADPKIDVVLVATTNDAHKDCCIRALRAGKHVICEKPVTTSAADLEEIMAAAKESGRVFTIDHNRRFNRDYVNLRRAIEKGLIGRPYVIESRVEGSRGVPAGWRTNKAQGGGMMYDWGVHLIDQMLDMIPEKVTSVYCKMYYVNYRDVDDNFRLTLTFASGLTAQIEIATNNFVRHPRFYAFGTEGSLVIDGWDGAGKVVRKLCDDNEWETDVRSVKAGPTKTMAPRAPGTEEEIALTEPKDVQDNLNPVYDQLVAAIEGAPLLIRPEQALRVLRVMEAAFRSAETGDAIHTDI